MKRLMYFIILMLVSFVSMSAKTADVTTFLGIPIDGTKTQMISKLQSKGFKYNQQDDCLTGQFNGTDVIVRVVTNNDKVYRIFVADENTRNESDIKIRFNTLIRQFLGNGKYIPVNAEQLHEEEDISYNMTVNNKRYQASFIQFSYTDEMKNMVDRYVQEHPGFDLASVDRNSAEFAAFAKELMTFVYQNAGQKSVWFMINETYGRYSILMFYDNELNAANGQDL